MHLSAAVRPEVHGDGRVNLFMRAGAAYDGMHDRPITHPSSWQREEIALDIPATARTLSFGLVLVGGGAASIDHVSLTVE